MLLAKYCTNNYPYELLTNEASKYLAQCSEFVTCCWRSTLIIGWKLREIALYFEKLLECPYLCTLETHEMLHQWVSCHHYVGIFLSLRPFTQWNWETSYSFSKWPPSFPLTMPRMMQQCSGSVIWCIWYFLDGPVHCSVTMHNLTFRKLLLQQAHS